MQTKLSIPLLNNMKDNVWQRYVLVIKDQFIIEHLFQSIINTSRPRRATVILILFIWYLHQWIHSRFLRNFNDWQESLTAIFYSSGRTALPNQTEGCPSDFQRPPGKACHRQLSETFHISKSPAGSLNAVCSPAATASHWSGQKCTGYFPLQQADSLIISRTAKWVLEKSSLSFVANI